MLWSKGIIWSAHIYLFGRLPCKWWRGVNVVMSQREGRECIIVFCNVSPGSLYSLSKENVGEWGQSRKKKIPPSIFRRPSGVHSSFYTGVLWKEPVYKAKGYFFSCVFCTRINEDRNHSHDCGLKLLRLHWTCYRHRLLSQPDPRMSCDFCE